MENIHAEDVRPIASILQATNDQLEDLRKLLRTIYSGLASDLPDEVPPMLETDLRASTLFNEQDVSDCLMMAKKINGVLF